METLFQVLVEPFVKYEFMQRALLASVVVGITCGIIGCFIILRGMALVGDAISHAVFPGVVIGFAVAGQALFALFLGALGAGLLCMLLIGLIHRNSRLKGDTATGVIFTAFFAFGILLISQMKKVHLDLNGYLFGDVLGVARSDLVFIVIVGALSLVVIFLFLKEFVVCSFDPILADALGIRTGFFHYLLMLLLTATVVTSLQAVGLILVVSMLITPGATAFMLTHRLPAMLGLAALFGCVAALVGLIVSYHLNVASGAAMVLVGFVFFVGVFFFAPGEGIIAKWLRRIRRGHQIQLEDFLKASIAIEVTAPPLTLEKTAHKLDVPRSVAHRVFHRMKQLEYLEPVEPRAWRLTTRGNRKALEIIRAHRLWETYLSQEAGLSWDMLDADADHIEHLLTAEMVEVLDESLGRPETDPHGAPIPDAAGQIRRLGVVPLATMGNGAWCRISRVKDDDPVVLRRLQEQGITPGTELLVQERTATWMVVQTREGAEKQLETNSAAHVLVSPADP